MMFHLPEGECSHCGLPYPDEETRETMPAGDPEAARFCWAMEEDECPKAPRAPATCQAGRKCRDPRCGDHPDADDLP